MPLPLYWMPLLLGREGAGRAHQIPLFEGCVIELAGLIFSKINLFDSILYQILFKAMIKPDSFHNDVKQTTQLNTHAASRYCLEHARKAKRDAATWNSLKIGL